MFISNAWAGEAADLAAEDPSFFVTMLPLLLVFVIFYVMILRPQNKRIAEHRTMINSLRRGDRVVTAGGLVATVKKLSGDDEVVLEISDGIQVTAVRSTLMTMRTVKPANDAVPEDKPKAKKSKKKK
jgi:preprotein translocase subunit YajC